ncbi:hypothetical protein [Nocardia cyriacigeorgica]|uniref:hypothetical protein n=1 Tax=Nocardia cyriacigeorgica TaxID=135487 RepID=UPI002453E443|nr:hypothetical protein [Nocardia cyriacigeorgica]
MNRNLIQTAIVAVAADAAVMAVVFAAAYVVDAKTRRRTRELLAASEARSTALRSTFPESMEVVDSLSEAEQDELRMLRKAEAGEIDFPEYFPSHNAYQAAISGYNPDLLSGDTADLRSLTMKALVSEITHAKAQLRQIRDAVPVSHEHYGPERSVIEMWVSHLGALKEEFCRRSNWRNSLSELDRAIADAAYMGVICSRDEWRSPGAAAVEVTDEDDPNHWSWDSRTCIHCDADAFRVDPDTAEYRCAGCGGRFMARPHDWPENEWESYRQRVQAETYISFAD